MWIHESIMVSLYYYFKQNSAVPSPHGALSSSVLLLPLIRGQQQTLRNWSLLQNRDQHHLQPLACKSILHAYKTNACEIRNIRSHHNKICNCGNYDIIGNLIIYVNIKQCFIQLLIGLPIVLWYDMFVYFAYNKVTKYNWQRGQPSDYGNT